jgi:hypothetical protein
MGENIYFTDDEIEYIEGVFDLKYKITYEKSNKILHKLRKNRVSKDISNYFKNNDKSKIELTL